MNVPKYKIGDQVIVASKSQDITYSLGFVQYAEINGGDWMYLVKIRNNTIQFYEKEIVSNVFETKDVLLNPELKEFEDQIKL